MGKSFWTRLFLPLASLFAISMFIHKQWEADGFFINLSTEVIGILITVFYVDWIIQQHEKRKWQSADQKINERLIILLNGIITRIRTSLEIDFDLLNDEKMLYQDLVVGHKELMRVAKDVIHPIVFQRIKMLDEKAWKTLHEQTKSSHNSLLSFLNVFQGRLDPDQIADLLDLQDALSKSLTFYTIFPELAGMPINRLPETRTPPEFLQLSGYETTAKQLQNVITLALKLSDSATIKNPHPPTPPP